LRTLGKNLFSSARTWFWVLFLERKEILCNWDEEANLVIFLLENFFFHFLRIAYWVNFEEVVVRRKGKKLKRKSSRSFFPDQMRLLGLSLQIFHSDFLRKRTVI